VLHYWKEQGYWNKYEYNEDIYEEDVKQDAYLVVLTAMQEHNPAKGKLSTCIRKVALRYLMRKRRYKQKATLQRQAAVVYTEERSYVQCNGTD
jgi:hypothetical protein